MSKKIIILIIIVLFITGCTTREPLYSNEFKTQLEKRNFMVVDKIETTDNKSIKGYYIATNNFNNYNIEYYEMDSEINALGFYLKYKESMIASGAQVLTEVSLTNYSKYVDNYNGKYRVVSRIANTIIWVEAPKEYQEEIKKLLGELSY